MSNEPEAAKARRRDYCDSRPRAQRDSRPQTQNDSRPRARRDGRAGDRAAGRSGSSRVRAGQEADAGLTDTITMMFERLRAAAAAHDRD